MSWVEELPYFSEHELACNHCGLVKLNYHFAAALVALRFEWGQPLTPTSVCRCSKHNKDVGGHEKSLHMTDNPHHDTEGCAAADIYWKIWPIGKKMKFAALAYRLGFSVGLNNVFCHIDSRKQLGISAWRVIFYYPNWNALFLASDIQTYDQKVQKCLNDLKVTQP